MAVRHERYKLMPDMLVSNSDNVSSTSDNRRSDTVTHVLPFDAVEQQTILSVECRVQSGIDALWKMMLS